MMTKRFLLIALASTAIIAMVCRPAVAAAKSVTLSPGDKYVALGDSFASGSGVAPLGNGPGDVTCVRTLSSYPQLLANALHLNLVNVACGGATTDDVLRPGGQIEAVTQDTKLVTISVGRNDLDSSANLLRYSCANDPSAVANAPNLPAFLAALICSPPVPGPTADELATLEDKLVRVVRAVQQRAPTAQIVLTDYINPLNECAAPCPTVPVAKADQKTVLAFERQVDLLIKHVARETNVLFADAAKAAKGHDACSSDPWIFGFTFGDFNVVGLRPYHPNLKGYTAVANLIKATL
jgi:lysophospholipase L1-like esterase